MTENDRALAYLTGALTGGARPAAVGLKFTPEGKPLICRGNTMICHVDPRSVAHAALVTAQERLRQGPLAQAFTFLPPQSLHMTIFEGVIDYSRRQDRWPGHLPTDAPIDAVTQDFANRLRGTGLAQGFTVRPEGIFGGFSVRIAGADPHEQTLLRQTRDRLQAASNLIRPDHDAYEFHITLAYNLRWFTPDEAQSVIGLSEAVGAELMALAPCMTLGPVEFCSFDTMHHFERLALID